MPDNSAAQRWLLIYLARQQNNKPSFIREHSGPCEKLNFNKIKKEHSLLSPSSIAKRFTSQLLSRGFSSHEGALSTRAKQQERVQNKGNALKEKNTKLSESFLIFIPTNAMHVVRKMTEIIFFFEKLMKKG